MQVRAGMSLADACAPALVLLLRRGACLSVFVLALQESDVVIWAMPQHPTRMSGAGITDDGRWAGGGAVGRAAWQKALAHTMIGCAMRVHCPNVGATVCGLLMGHGAVLRPGLPVARYLELHISEGCLPANRIYIVDMAALAKDDNGDVAWTKYDFIKGGGNVRLGTARLPARLLRTAGWAAS
jgi:hypothetical protein